MKRALQSLLSVWLCFCSLHAPADPEVLRLATTTSTENSGLLKVILPKFETRSGLEVRVLAVGTGQALRLGCNGDVDVVLVHAPAAEQKFVDDGGGVNRRPVMYNDFVIVGPPADPAGIAHCEDAAVALARIAKSRAIFVSRGDDSGTNKKELSLWQKAGINPSGTWYREAGQGMGKVLQITAELGGYTLTDRGTWLAYRAKSRLNILVEEAPALYNPYAEGRKIDQWYAQHRLAMTDFSDQPDAFANVNTPEYLVRLSRMSGLSTVRRPVTGQRSP